MSIEQNLTNKSSQIDNNLELKLELEAALELIKSYETMIAELNVENNILLRRFTHDLASPLQILSMTIESLESRIPSEMNGTLERMKRSTENMCEILRNVRKLHGTLTPKDIKSI